MTATNTQPAIDAPRVLVRTATPTDEAAVRRLVAAAYREYEASLSPDLFAAYMENLLDVEGHEGAELFVAESDGEIVGTVRFYADAGAAGFGWPARWSALRALAVDSDHRRSGIGHELIDACVERATVAGAQTLGLHTAHFMVGAIALYERSGFTRAPAFDLRADDVLDVADPDGPLVIAYQLDLVPASFDAYPLGRTEAETRRLILQAQIYGPLTRRLFSAAGITRGMKVLDLGSGAGDVALLAADLVGPEGHVVGVDANESILATARQRAAVLGANNVEFVAGDLHDLHLAGEFDAVVGRWILMYLSDPADLLRRVQAHVRPGGIVAILESADLRVGTRTFPPLPVHEEVMRWMTAPPDEGGVSTNTGLRLFGTFLAAGLPAPQLHQETPIGGGPAWPGYAYLASSVSSLLPFLERYGMVTAAEVDVDTLEERLRREVVEAGAVQVLPTVIGAWAHRR